MSVCGWVGVGGVGDGGGGGQISLLMQVHSTNSTETHYSDLVEGCSVL